ncbi:MAG: hypothetical protein WCK73_16690 [Deltaproteobacteria bacterium]
MRLRLGIAYLAAAALLAPATGRASELEATSSTQLNIQSQWRAGATTEVVPLYEFLTLTGREVDIPGGKLYFQVDGWGAANLGSNPWWNGYTNTGALSADLNLAWVQGRFLDNQLRVTLGRQTIGYGNSRMLQLDGGALQLVIHKMVTLDAYVGAPTTQRFTAYGSIFSAAPTIGNLAVGGRLGFAWTSWLNVGASAAFSWNDGAATREDLAVDLRFSPVSWAYLLGYLDWSLFAGDYYSGFGGQVADANLSLVFPVTQFLQFTAEYTYSVPSLALPYNSILWVFSDNTHQYVGATARVGLEQFKVHVPLDFEVGYRHIFEEWSTFGSTDTGGNRYFLRATWRPTKTTTVGAETSRLWMPDQGYWQARAFASAKAYGFTGTLDFQGYWFDDVVNLVKQSIIGSATLGYDVGGGFAVVGALQGGSTPYYTSYVNGLVKLTYNATYRSREVYE